MPGELGHAGDLSPDEAMAMIDRDPKAVLVDVRTEGEWATVGVPDLAATGRPPVLIEWARAPAMTPNPTFAEELEAALAARGVDASAPLLFLCRSGARSTAAARACIARGYPNSYNVAGGFEGSPAAGLPGWRRSGLPWKVD